MSEVEREGGRDNYVCMGNNPLLFEGIQNQDKDW